MGAVTVANGSESTKKIKYLKNIDKTKYLDAVCVSKNMASAY